MRLNNALDKIFNNQAKVRTLRIFCLNPQELSGRQVANAAGVAPRTAHEILQELLREGILSMHPAGKAYLFRLNEDLSIVKDVIKPLFAAEDHLTARLFDLIRGAIRKSPLKDDILSVAVFGSVHEKKDDPASDVDLLVIVRTADSKKGAEELFSEIDRQTSASWGNLISPYVNSLSEFKSKASQKAGIVPHILKSYQLLYGDRLEKLLR